MASIYPGLEGLLSGFQARKQQVEQQNYARALQQSQSESAVFQALLNSSDPEIRAKAATGLLTSAMGPQKSGGIRGWLGEMDQNPIVAQMRTLMATPTTQEVPTQVPTGEPAALPSRNITGTIGQPPTTALAQPSTQTTTPGAPGPTATTPDGAAAGAAATPLPPTVGRPPSLDLQTGPLSHPTAPTQTVMQTEQVPREIFPTAEEQAVQRYRGEYMGQVQGIAEGLIAGGMPREQAYQVAEMHFMRSLGGGVGAIQSKPGVNASGQYVEGTFDRRPFSPTYGKWIDQNDQIIPGFLSMSVQGRSTDREGLSRQLFDKPFSQLDADEAGEVNRQLVGYGAAKTTANTQARTQVEAGAPLSTPERSATVRELTQQYNTDIRPIRQAQLANTRLQAALGTYDADPNGSTQAILNAFEEIVNPQSGVSSSEFAKTGEGQSLLQRAQAAYQKYTQGGQGVTKANLQELATTANALMEAMGPWSELYETQIRNSAKAGKLSDEETEGIFGVSPNVGVSPAAATATPTAQSPRARGTQPTQPSSDWTMVNGVLYYKGKPYR